jgi:hypothetical protein
VAKAAGIPRLRPFFARLGCPEDWREGRRDTPASPSSGRDILRRRGNEIARMETTLKGRR